VAEVEEAEVEAAPPSVEVAVEVRGAMEEVSW